MVQVQDERLPRHIAFIMDGNGRWAAEKNRPVAFGHREGAEALRRTIDHGKKRLIQTMTFFAFSTENWKRARHEVSFLMNLAFRHFMQYVEEAEKHNVRIRIVGDRTDVRIPPRVKDAIAAVEAATAACYGMDVNFCFNYGGEDDLLHAGNMIAELAARGEFKESQLDAWDFREHLLSRVVPDVDLLVRTSGEQRISNFLPFQAKYAELHFPSTLWPDFNETTLDDAIAVYLKRDRRFGARHSKPADLVAAE